MNNKKVVVITGGSNGIGKETALKFLKNEYAVVVIDNDKTACDTLRKEFLNINIYNIDITDYDKVRFVIGDIIKKYKHIDILINNAAIQTTFNIMNLKIEDWSKVVDVNLTATFFMTQTVAKVMSGGGTILNIISTHYNKPRCNRINYDVSKAGISMLTKSFAMELANRNITVNALGFGATYTNMNSCFISDKKVEEEAINKIPLHHICSAQEISNLIYNTIISFSSYTTGSILIVDEGRSLI